ncbi:plastid-lipid associated protein PAP / fibrillin family protein [Tasmannia lanceolata]|uniref:plastid-lipid associated protein PAP / fibrillin family protein n=1 Tax=Tasmannia lanceolata TaxID=3420 RepID=UPI0040643B7C
MSLLLTSSPSRLFQNPRTLRLLPFRSLKPSLSFSKPPSFPILNAFSSEEPGINPLPGKIPIQNGDSEEKSQSPIESSKTEESEGIPDEWGEKAESEPEASYTKLSDADPRKEEDEWGGEEENSGFLSGNGSAGVSDKGEGEFDKLLDLKRALVDSCYGTEFGFRASSETRAEIVELVNQLEAVNPTPAPNETPLLLNGNWILLYTAFSELLPLLAVGTLPLLKLKRISQEIDTGSLAIQNSATFSSPTATFSFSASASFEVRSPSRIQVQFKEGIFQPPEISSSVNLPESFDIFGQKIDLLPVQRLLNPLQEAVANLSRVISGQPPLKVSIPGERTVSWLVTTFLDKDIRISRGDGGLFVLVKEGSLLQEYK